MIVNHFARLFAKTSHICSQYPYEIIVFYVVLSIGIWPFAESSRLITLLFKGENTNTNELGVLIVVAKCMSIMHIFYQIKKLKLIRSIWLLFAVGIIGLTICLNLSVVSGVVTFHVNEHFSLISTLPILLLVTELDFIHALFLMTLKSLSNLESIPQSIKANMQVLSPRALATALLDLSCMLVIIIGNSTFSSGEPDQGFRFALKLTIISIVFNFILFITFTPAIITLLLYHLPRKPLEKLTHDPELEYLITRASQTLKLGSGFEVFTLITATFFLAQSRVVLSTIIKRFLPDVMVIFLRDFISPFFPFSISLVKTGATTLLLVSIFRYLILDHVRNSRIRVVTIPKKVDRQIETEVPKPVDVDYWSDGDSDNEKEVRPIEELRKLLKEDKCDLMSNAEVIELVDRGSIRMHALEKILHNPSRGVYIRRKMLNSPVFRHIRMENYDFSLASKSCCENIVGYLQMPLGQVGPLKVDNISVNPIMATTEGALLASVNRGCKLLTTSGGVTTHVFKDSMSRAPCLMFESVTDLMKCSNWITKNFDLLKTNFESTTRFGKLESLGQYPAGRYLYLRVNASTGDAMGMNMVSKGSEQVVKAIMSEFPSARCVSLSGNACTDKKPSAMNWIEGRGKQIIAECMIPEDTCRAILKVTVDQIEKLNIQKNLIGSSVAGSIGGFNAHAANVIAACFLATGQDPAQVVEGSQTMTLFEKVIKNKKVYLHVSVTMKSLEVAARGGGTVLQPQNAIMNHYLSGFETENIQPGDKARRVASVIASTVLAGELSLMAALCSGELVQSHMKLNRLRQKSTSDQNQSHNML